MEFSTTNGREDDALMKSATNTVTDQERTNRRLRLEEAEGYLDLITVFADRWPASPEVRNRLAERALEALQHLDETHVNRTRVLYLRGQALLTMERFSEAIVPLETATQNDDQDIHLWLSLGWCYKRVGRLDLAIQALEEAIAVEPDQALIHYNLACYWSLANNPKLAVKYLSSAFEIDPNYRDMVSSEADFDKIRNHPDFLALTTVIV